MYTGESKWRDGACMFHKLPSLFLLSIVRSGRQSEVRLLQRRNQSVGGRRQAFGGTQKVVSRLPIPTGKGKAKSRS